MPPYQFGNTINDFYLRQAQQLSQQNPQYQQQMLPFPNQQPLNFPIHQQPSKPSIVASAVTNVEEARATRIEPMTAYIFLDTSCGKIYLKQFQADGTSSFITFAQEQVSEENDNTMSILDRRLSNIEAMIGELKNAKPVPNVRSVTEESSGVYSAANAAENAKSEPAVIPKGNGHGWKQK